MSKYYKESKELAKALQKALPQAQLSQRANLQLVHGQPVWMNDNPEQYVNEAFLFNANVYSIIDTITKAASQVQWDVYEVKDEKSLRKYKRQSLTNSPESLASVSINRNKSLELVEDNMLKRRIEKPNPIDTWTDIVTSMLGFKLITGEYFLHGIRTNKNLFGELWSLPSQLMEIAADQNVESVITGYWLRYNSSRQKIAPENILHGKYWNPDYSGVGSHLRGLSPLRAGRKVVTRNNSAYVANASLLQNMGAHGILEADPEHTTKEQGEAIQNKYQRTSTGPYNRGKLVVAAGKLKWHAIGMSPDDLAIIDTQNMDMRDLCNIYNIDSSIFNDPDGSTYNNKNEAYKQLYYGKVFPELTILRDQLNSFLVQPYSEADGKQYFIDFDPQSVPSLNEDWDKMADWLSKAWWLTANEKRIAMRYESDDNMDKYFIPANLIPDDGTNLEKSFVDYEQD